jgi:multidrug efflux pump subunit AcrA (membrane-fusion protein)
LYEKKFLSKDELDRDEIALLNAEATFKKTKLDVVVYENYTHKQDEQKKQSDLQQSSDELDRAEERLASELNNLTATVLARKDQLESQVAELEKRKTQLEMCVVLSPASGMVVYATSMGNRRDEGEPLKVGKSLYRNELVMTIPDISNMIARVKVNEALSGLVAAGQKATVMCDAYPDDVFDGEVLLVGVLAEGGGWRDPNRRDYTVEIKIKNQGNVRLKPSMRCSAEVFVEKVTDVLFVPIHAIHRTGKVVWVWLRQGSGYAQHPVELGRFSDSYAEITSGLSLDNFVLLREPPPSEVVARLVGGDGE